MSKALAGNACFTLEDGDELDDAFSGLRCPENLISIAGFGSLLSETSARSTFPDLINFRKAKLVGYRRVFAHTCAIFFDRGIARPVSGEISSLSVERYPQSEIIVTVFEIPAHDKESIDRFIEREHEFRFLATYPHCLESGVQFDRPAVVCAANTDESYKTRRCDAGEWEKRYGRHGLKSIWGYSDILPCRVYLRHCYLAAKSLGTEAEASFLDGTVLADRYTTVREYLGRNPDILREEPPMDLIGRYSG